MKNDKDNPPLPRLCGVDEYTDFDIGPIAVDDEYTDYFCSFDMGEIEEIMKQSPLDLQLPD